MQEDRTFHSRQQLQQCEQKENTELQTIRSEPKVKATQRIAMVKTITVTPSHRPVETTQARDLELNFLKPEHNQNPTGQIKVKPITKQERRDSDRRRG